MDLNKKKRISERNKRYYEKHKTELAEKKKKHYLEHKEEYAERMKKYYLENKEELAIKHKKYYEEHKYKISKKHSKLIDITVSIPSIEELSNKYERLPEDHRANTEECLLAALETICQGMHYEDTCKEMIEKAKTVFKYYEK